MSASVLVMDAGERKSVPIIRALGRAGIDVVAGESSRWSMGFYSRYTRERHVYPPPEDEGAFVEWLISRAKAGAFDTIIPVDERTMTPVTRWRDALQQHARVPVVGYDTYMVARDKQRTLAAAEKVGVAVPRTWWFASVEEFRDRRPELDTPLVLKPRISSGSKGVRYVDDPGALESAYLEIHSRYPLPLIQEWIPAGGETYGVELLFDRGDSVARFMHRRLREYPVSGGPSTLRESVHDKNLIENAERLLSYLEWHGVAMVEFKVDPRDGIAKLMEINAKFWGSIALPILCGVNFPEMLYRIARGEAVEAAPPYPVNVRSRWLLPGDILHFVTNPDRWRLQPSFFDLGAPDDLIDRSDLGPVYGLFVSFLSRSLTKSFWIEKILRTG